MRGGWHQVWPLLRLKRQYKDRLRIIATTHSYHLDQWSRIPVSWLYFHLYRRVVDHVIFQCPYAARRFVNAARLFREGRASIIPLGVEPLDEAAGRMPDEACGSPDLRPLLANHTERHFNFVYLAVFRRGKDQLWLIRAMAPILRVHPHVRLLLLGAGPEFGVCEAVAESVGLRTQILMPGHVERRAVPWVLGRCHCSVTPTRAETFGHSVVEPMTLGLPVVGTRVGAAEYLIQDYVTGLGFPKKDQAAFSAAIRFMIDHPDAAAEMGERARAIARQLFTFEVVAAAHRRLYERLLSGT